MTPEREAYWKKCSLKERTLRALINDEKCAIKVLKNNFKYPENYNFNILLIMISQCKVRLSAYCHELQRLKGMDRVVIPSEQYDRRFKTYNWYCTKCDSEISVFGNYCPTCGRKILWKKASECWQYW